MTFKDLKTFTYIGNIATVDGIDIRIPTQLDVSIKAVQYHKGYPMLEEKDDGYIEVEINKYQVILDEWTKAKNLIDNPPPPSQEELKIITKQNKDLLISKSTAEVHTILYDTDEKSMDRMNRIVSLANAEYNYRVSVGETPASAYEASYKTQTVDWTGADDKPHKVMVESIVQALRVGMTNMGEIWHGN